MSETVRAGRELDALVAEKVMGYRWSPSTNASIQWLREDATGGWVFAKRMPDGQVRVAESCPRYSTDIGAAMEVVTMLAPKIAGRVSMDVTGKDAACGIGFSEDIQPYVRAKTLPLAICLAALKAVEANPPRKTPVSPPGA